MPYLGPGIDNGFRSRFIYTATAGQTSFSGGDSQGITLTYTDSEYLDVYQNGVLLVPGDDYAATTGTTVVLVQGASLNDKVEMIQYQAFGVADTVSRADGGAFGGNISTSGTLAVTGVPTFTGRSVHSGGITIANAGQIGSVGDTDAIAISSGGVVTFSGGTVGAGIDLLLDTTISSAVANFDISSTYLNGTYDTYLLQGSFLPATDNQVFNSRVFVGDTIITAESYHYASSRIDASNYGNDNSHTSMFLTDEGAGNVAGEGVTVNLTLQNLNTTPAFSLNGIVSFFIASAAPNSVNFSGGLKAANHADVVNGIRFFFASGNIASGYVRLYGIRT